MDVERGDCASLPARFILRDSRRESESWRVLGQLKIHLVDGRKVQPRRPRCQKLVLTTLEEAGTTISNCLLFLFRSPFHSFFPSRPQSTRRPTFFSSRQSPLPCRPLWIERRGTSTKRRPCFSRWISIPPVCVLPAQRDWNRALNGFYAPPGEHAKEKDGPSLP